MSLTREIPLTDVCRFGRVTYELNKRTYIMGILNVTPDSFSDGGRYDDISQAIDAGLRMVDEGADFIDIGGESTRPGALPVSAGVELERVLTVIQRLARATDCPLSIDTYKAEVARKALEAGAAMVNDISGFTFDPVMADVVSEFRVPVILMHTSGSPQTMQQDPTYTDLIGELCTVLGKAVRTAESKGIDCIFVDPGIGFGKTVSHNCEIIKRLHEFKRFGYPLCVGPSRKGFIGKILDLPVEERLEGTLAAVAASIMNGASILRVHDVRESVRVARVIDAIVRA
jgi:dihydropteroate synthase